MSKLLVGLTGGVATGKSLVAGELERLGASVIDADAVAREVTVKGSPVLAGIVRVFGPEVLNPDGTLDRRALGKVVFADREKLRLLNAVTHPEILRRIRERVEGLKKKAKGPIIVINAALLIETGLHEEVDRVVVVHAERQRQVERAVRRDSISAKEAEERISSQMPMEGKMALADHLVDNNGTIEETLKAASRLYESLVAGAR